MLPTTFPSSLRKNDAHAAIASVRVLFALEQLYKIVVYWVRPYKSEVANNLSLVLLLSDLNFCFSAGNMTA
jgi:hypothetical protein